MDSNEVLDKWDEHRDRLIQSITNPNKHQFFITKISLNQIFEKII